jgi:opacity protein-like surface antigen
MRKLIPVVALALVGVAGVSSAQSPVKFQPSINAGISVPTGTFKNDFQTGYTAGAALDMHFAMIPLGWRAEASYTHMGLNTGVPGFSASTNDVSGRLNAVLHLPMVLISPYFIGGYGMYHVSASGSDAQNKFGWNAGVGMDLPLGPIGGRIEARYHSISMDNGQKYTYLPVTFGIRF